MDLAQQLALLQHVLVVAGTKSTTVTSRGSPLRGHSVQTPSSAAVSEIIAPAGSDMQTLPPMVAAFQILNDIRNEFMHFRNSGTARHPGGPSKSCSSTTRQVAAMSRPASVAVSGAQPRSVEIDQRVDGHLWLGEQPGTPGQPRIAFTPAIDVVNGCRALDFSYRGQIHDRPRSGLVDLDRLHHAHFLMVHHVAVQTCRCR